MRTLACLLAAAAVFGITGTAWAEDPDPVLDLPVFFHVTNGNTSGLPCQSDGLPYAVHGHLVGFQSAFTASGPKTVTYYLHDLGDGEWVWRFGAVPGYDFAVEMAKLGHVSLTVDEIGYDASGKPVGMQSCLGSQADVAHQVVGQLRSGGYSVEGGTPIAFSRVVLFGHSVGAQIAQIEAYSYKDIDALAEFGYADQGPSQHALSTGVDAGVRCQTSPERSDGDKGPTGYVYFDRTEQQYVDAFFNRSNADPAVVAAAGPLRNRFPCGDIYSLPLAVAVDGVRLREVTVPVLLIYGEKDAVYPASGERSQRSSFSGTDDLTSAFLANSGHAAMIEREAPTLRGVISTWLAAHGLGGAPALPVAPPVAPLAAALVTIGRGVVAVGERRLAPVHVRCHAQAGVRCRGQLVLETAARRAVRLGARAFSVRGGTSRAVPVRLSKTGYRLLRRRGRLRVRAAAHARAGDDASVRVVSALWLRARRAR